MPTLLISHCHTLATYQHYRLLLGYLLLYADVIFELVLNEGAAPPALGAYRASFSLSLSPPGRRRGTAARPAARRRPLFSEIRLQSLEGHFVR